MVNFGMVAFFNTLNAVIYHYLITFALVNPKFFYFQFIYRITYGQSTFTPSTRMYRP